MAYWLFKSEPGTWSWDDHVNKGTEHWNGVRNHQANNNMKAMQAGDRGFFYHSGDERQIVGIVEVVRQHYPDHTDASGRFGMVDLEAVTPVNKPVTLTNIRANRKLADMVLVKNSRLSVQPVTAAEWQEVCRMAGVSP
jgi:predicted RNA-binding protein with PUA-like domain